MELLHHLGSADTRAGLADYLGKLREAKRAEDDRFDNLVNEWEASGVGKTIEKWRSKQVERINGAWRRSGDGPISFAERENSYWQKESGSSRGDTG